MYCCDSDSNLVQTCKEFNEVKRSKSVGRNYFFKKYQQIETNRWLLRNEFIVDLAQFSQITFINHCIFLVLASRTIEFIIDHSDEFGQPLGQQHLTEGAIRPLGIWICSALKTTEQYFSLQNSNPTINLYTVL